MSKKESKGILITIWGIVVNTILAGFKLVAGLIGNSSALIADAIHSTTDIASDICVLIGLVMAKKPADEKHKYGHGKFETLAGALVGLILIGAGFGIGHNALDKAIDIFNGEIVQLPGKIALVAALFSIVIKEVMYQVTIREARKTGSKALEANAWHHRSDAFSSIAAFIGVLGAIILGEKWIILDPIAGLVVCILIIVSAAKITINSVDELLEKSLDEKQENRIKDIFNNIPGFENAHSLKTRAIGTSVAIDIHICVDPQMTVKKSHDLTLVAEKKLYDIFGKDTIINIHVEPYDNHKEEDNEVKN